MSIKEFTLTKAEEKQHVTVSKSGLIICREHTFLAASPDGKVETHDDEFGLLEVKNLLHSKPVDLYQAAQSIKSFYPEIQNDNSLRLKRLHEFYYQVQGQLPSSISKTLHVLTT